MVEFAGPGTRFSAGAVEQAAHDIGCDIAAVQAVIDVESRGGFLPDNRPKILFERHYFSRLTGHRFDATAPDVSNPASGGYLGGAREYERLGKAIALDRDAALRSASWGAFQVMGDNCAVCGFSNVQAFVDAMVASEDGQLKAFVGFVKGNHLDDELRRLDWAGFARGYNGPNYRQNRYDEKMAAAYALHRAGAPRTETVHPTLSMGTQGEAVKALQGLLKITADGDFGPATKAAVVAAQNKAHLTPDGVAGPRTWAALGG